MCEGTRSPAAECRRIYKESLSLLAVDRLKLEDTLSEAVYFSKADQAQIVDVFSIDFRPDFSVVLLKTADQKSMVALIPKKKSHPNDFVGQQVMQWQKIDIAYDQIEGITQPQKRGAIYLNLKNFPELATANARIQTKLIVAKPITIEPTSFATLLTQVKNNPKIHLKEDRPSPYKNVFKFLFAKTHEGLARVFGKKWVDISGPRGEYNALKSSREILDTQKTFIPQKQKVLHVIGEVFSAEFVVSEGIPYSGFLRPGRYFTVGRLSSSMKNMEMLNDRGEPEANSLAMGLLLFKTRDQQEVPGALFFQDSLLPTINPGLKDYRMSNNPGFAYRPKNLREALEQGFTIAGVGLASALSKLDSGRGIQGNFRSNLNAASHSVDFQDGATVWSPRFLSIELLAKTNLQKTHHIDSIRGDADAKFIIQASEDGKSWIRLGQIEKLDWMGIDSHELTFPHGLSGTIDPLSLKPAGSSVGIKGLQLPTDVNSVP